MVALNSDIQPGELAHTVDCGALYRRYPGRDPLVCGVCDIDAFVDTFVDDNGDDPHCREFSGHYARNEQVLVIANIPDRKRTCDDGRIFSPILVLTQSGALGWLWAHEVYGRIPHP